MEIDITKEKEELLKSLKLKLSFLENFAFYSTILPIPPIFILYIEYLFIKSIKHLENKLKPLDIKLYHNPLYLLDYITIFSTLLYFLFYNIPFYLLLTYPIYGLICFFTGNLNSLFNYLIKFFSIFWIPSLLILILFFPLLIFLVNKNTSTYSNICESLYKLTNIPSFKELSNELLTTKKNPIISQYKNKSKINLLYILNNQYEVLEKLYESIEKIENKIILKK